MSSHTPVTSRWRNIAALVASLLIPAACIQLVSRSAGSTTAAIPRDLDLVKGKELFLARCATCHSFDKNSSSRLGPALRDIGRVAGRRKEGLEAAEYILESIVEPAAFRAPGALGKMPENVVGDLNDTEIKCLVAFLASLGTDPDFQSVSELVVKRRPVTDSPPLDVSRERMELGVRVFFGKGQCASCHRRFGIVEHQVHAPGIFNVGLRDRKAIYRSIVDPQHDVADLYRLARVVTIEGEVLTGRIVDRTPSAIVMLTQADKRAVATLRTISWDEIDAQDGKPAVARTQQSAMPTGYAELLSAEELAALVDLILLLN